MQNLEEFVKELIDDAEKFKQYWKTSRKNCKDKSCWPLELENGEWFEMFLMYERV